MTKKEFLKRLGKELEKALAKYGLYYTDGEFRLRPKMAWSLKEEYFRVFTQGEDKRLVLEFVDEQSQKGVSQLISRHWNEYCMLLIDSHGNYRYLDHQESEYSPSIVQKVIRSTIGAVKRAIREIGELKNTDAGYILSKWADRPEESYLLEKLVQHPGSLPLKSVILLVARAVGQEEKCRSLTWRT